MSYKADHHSLNSPLITTQEPLIDFDNLSESELKKRREMRQDLTCPLELKKWHNRNLL